MNARGNRDPSDEEFRRGMLGMVGFGLIGLVVFALVASSVVSAKGWPEGLILAIALLMAWAAAAALAGWVRPLGGRGPGNDDQPKRRSSALGGVAAACTLALSGPIVATLSDDASALILAVISGAVSGLIRWARANRLATRRE